MMRRYSKNPLIKLTQIDYLLLITVMVLVVFGLSLIYSASSYKAAKTFGSSSYYLQQHFIRILIALVAMIIVAAVDYHFWLKLSPFALLFSFILLLFLFSGSPLVQEVNGAKRWLKIGSIQFQPADFARVALILSFAKSLTQNRERLEDFFKGFLPYIALLSSICILIYLQPDLSTASLIAMVGCIMLFVGGAEIGHLLAVGTSFLTIALFFTNSSGYQLQRLIIYLNRIFNQGELPWQAKQSLVSLAQGGLCGQGLGAGRAKYDWLPEPHKDFIFSILGEELGIIGTVGVLVLFLVVVWRGIRIAACAPDGEGRLLAAGITSSIGLYALVNAAVACALVPTTGIPMPFISYGGSSLISNLAAVGLLMNISSQSKESYENYPAWWVYRKRLLRPGLNGGRRPPSRAPR